MTRLLTLVRLRKARGPVFSVVLSCDTLVRLWATSEVRVPLLNFRLHVTLPVSVTMPPIVLLSLVLTILAAQQGWKHVAAAVLVRIRVCFLLVYVMAAVVGRCRVILCVRPGFDIIVIRVRGKLAILVTIRDTCTIALSLTFPTSEIRAVLGLIRLPYIDRPLCRAREGTVRMITRVLCNILIGLLSVYTDGGSLTFLRQWLPWRPRPTLLVMDGLCVYTVILLLVLVSITLNLAF